MSVLRAAAVAGRVAAVLVILQAGCATAPVPTGPEAGTTLPGRNPPYREGEASAGPERPRLGGSLALPTSGPPTEAIRRGEATPPPPTIGQAPSPPPASERPGPSAEAPVIVPAAFQAPAGEKPETGLTADAASSRREAKAGEGGPPAGEPQVTGEKKEPWYSVHEQGTVITQLHPPFRSPYIGPNSLRPDEGAATTETATLFLVARAWEGGEVLFNPEISGGRGLSGTTGMAGFPNGEATRVGIPEPTPYIARLLVRQTWELDGPGEKVEDAPNQIAAARRQINRITVSAGKMSATDLADANAYSHDPRTQFQNWTLVYNGAWDYPANTRGYTYGATLDFNTLFWAVHYGIFGEPTVANGSDIDPHFVKANGQILELVEQWGVFDGRPGKLRQWVFVNHANMGNYGEALRWMPVAPDVTATRSYRYKYGFGGNLEQEVARGVGVFAKAGWNDGHSETWAFTEVDRTAAAGVLVKGVWWGRPDDEAGLAGVINGLSGAHRDYLAAGGVGFIIGDGRLNYAPERIAEVYYNWRLAPGVNVTLDVQGVAHPAYNADRGPAAIVGVRVHMEH